MSTHSYVLLNFISTHNPSLTGNIVVEAYESPDRPYAMVVFRAATLMDETTNHIMQSHGYSAKRGPSPPPTTGLLCRSGTNLHSVWQWLAIHKGRLAYVVNEPLLTSIVTVVRPPVRPSPYGVPRRRNVSRDSVDSALPTYEPPPPSLHCSSVHQSIREEDTISSPPPYWEIAQETEYGRQQTTRVAAAAVAAVFGTPTQSLMRRASQTTSRSARTASRQCQYSVSLAGGGLARTFTQSMPSLVPLHDEQAVAAAIEDSRQQAVATASTSNNEHAIRYVQQSVASVAVSDAAQRERGGFLHSFQGQVRMARLSARTNPEHNRGSKRHSGWLWRLLNM
ncbi:hypothetical protein GGI18_004997 [Coemansia linderi]|uniref:Uncharacterized protein n=1 Tax=Coemansia linderi TaxID=2663919 RepID=A0ACC1K1F3_9FUNG|nr:hypothetical protein GGI18_004997 [Coemansia linderi]